MTIQNIENDQKLQRILWACYQYWQGDSEPLDKRAVCYSWVSRIYEENFGVTFHQSKLGHLAKLGFLQPDDTSRGGNRRYYKLVNPENIAALLKSGNYLKP